MVPVFLASRHSDKTVNAPIKHHIEDFMSMKEIELALLKKRGKH